MIEQGRMIKVTHDPGLPNVEIEEVILNPEFRYGVQIDPRKFGYLLFASGIPAEKVSKYTLLIKTDDDSPNNGSAEDDILPYAHYDTATKTASVYIERLLDDYCVAKDDAEAIMSGASHTVTRPFKKFLTTKRLPEYLQAAPPQRSEAFVKKLFGITLRRRFKETLVHEANHAVVTDGMNEGFIFSGLSNRVAWRLHNLRNRIKPMSKVEKYLKDPLEKIARKAEKDRKLNDAAEGILVFQFNRPT